MTALAMAALETLVPKVRRDVPNCPDPIIVDELAEAARDFCRQTTVWRNECPAITIETDVHTYRLRHPDGLPHRIHEATYQAPDQTSRRPLFPLNEHRARGGAGYGDYHQTFHPVGQSQDWKIRTGTPRWYSHYLTNLDVRVIPIPTSSDADGFLHFTVSLLPKMDARRLPEWIVERYYEALVAGAKARLLKMANQQWTDANKGALENDLFEKELAIAKAEVIQSFTTMNQRVEPRFPLA